ncbi:hypothetical protein BT69DRAFT_1279347 [Atractiella rhizophila]|nr:hypothetical protein BT69DRAFT_1279347 [Atractiella rhizophila]
MDSRYSTLRGPPPPPKPLHLTVSRITGSNMQQGLTSSPISSDTSDGEEFFSDASEGEGESVLGTLKGKSREEGWEGTVRKQREMWESRFAPAPSKKVGVIGGKTGGAQRGVGDLKSLWDKVEVDVEPEKEDGRKGKRPVGKRRETIWDAPSPTSPSSPIHSPALQDLPKRGAGRAMTFDQSPFKDLFSPLPTSNTSSPSTSNSIPTSSSTKTIIPSDSPPSHNRSLPLDASADADAEEEEAPRTIKGPKRKGSTLSRRERYASRGKNGKGSVKQEMARKSVLASLKKGRVRDTVLVLGDLLKEMQALDSDNTFTNPPSPDEKHGAIAEEDPPSPSREAQIELREGKTRGEGRSFAEVLAELHPTTNTSSPVDSPHQYRSPKQSVYSSETVTDEDGYATAPQSTFAVTTATVRNGNLPSEQLEVDLPRHIPREDSIFPEDSVSNFRRPVERSSVPNDSIDGETATDLISDLQLEVEADQTHPLLKESTIPHPLQTSPDTLTVVLPPSADMEPTATESSEEFLDEPLLETDHQVPDLQSLQSPSPLPTAPFPTTAQDLPPPRPARALFSFSGESSFGELAFSANKILQIEVENLGGGWSLGYVEGIGEGEGERGLIPRGWYTFIQEMRPPAPSEGSVKIEGWVPGSRINSISTAGDSAWSERSMSDPERQATGGSTLSIPSLGVKNLVSSLSTATGAQSVPIYFSQNTTPEAACFQPPIKPAFPKSRQTPGIVQSTFKYLTGAYVPGGWEDSGADEWVRNGSPEAESDEKWWIEQGPSWREIVAYFEVDVHSPSKRSAHGSKEYTIFQVSSEYEEEIITVERRFNDFVKLHNYLIKSFSTLIIPPLPSKQYTGRFRSDFVEARRRDLRCFIRRVVRHPVLRASEGLKLFLEMEDREQFQAEMKKLEEVMKANPKRRWMTDVNHPDFNVDPMEAKETLDRFTSFAHNVEKGGGVRDAIDQTGLLRASMRATSSDLRLLAHDMVKMSSGLSLPPEGTPTIPEHDESDSDKAAMDSLEKQRIRARNLRLQNEDGAWCWREKCDDCLSASKALQESAEATEKVAQLYEQNAASALLSVQEVLRDVAYPHSHHASLIDVARSALNLNEELDEEDSYLRANNRVSVAPSPNEGMSSRNETILNIAMSEISRSHSEHSEDIRIFVKEYLDSQIEFHQKALLEFSRARVQLEDEMYRNLAVSGPRLPSLLEKTPKLPPPLPELTSYRIPGAPVGATKKASVMDSLLPGTGLVRAATSRSFFS